MDPIKGLYTAIIILFIVNEILLQGSMEGRHIYTTQFMVLIPKLDPFPR
jgi:hypothetical protein